LEQVVKYFTISGLLPVALGVSLAAQQPSGFQPPPVFRSGASLVAHQYSIGYSPSNARTDGRDRRIVVRIATHPELRPRARSGYLAERTTLAPASDETLKHR
jgi:hypothetical protein